MLYLFHLYIKHLGGSTLATTIREVCYWKFIITKSEFYAKPFKICQQFKRINTLYGRLSPNNIAELRLWYMVHVDLIGPYIKSIRQ